jgi:FAD/FMN-containing dehydrogenase
MTDTEKHIEAIKQFFAGDVDATDRTRDTYSRDMSIFSVTPELVVFPKNAADIAALVRYVVKENAENAGKGIALSLTARSGGTDMTGGALTSSIVVDCARYIN